MLARVALALAPRCTRRAKYPIKEPRYCGWCDPERQRKRFKKKWDRIEAKAKRRERQDVLARQCVALLAEGHRVRAKQVAREWKAL